MNAQEIDQDTFVSAQAGGAWVVDVREPHEYEAGHVPGAVNIPLGHLPGRVGEVSGHDTVYVVCQSGGRSRKGAEAMLAGGVDAVSVSGGTKDWHAAGNPLTTGSAP